MTTKGDSLGDRMKRYEGVTKQHLMARTPVIIRIDGRAFHTFTRSFKKELTNTPFSNDLHDAMVFTTQALVEGVQNCVFGYTQSDEISLFLRDWDLFETEQWFSGSVQKIVSVAASIATAAFNYKMVQLGRVKTFKDLAQFDARAYNIPKEEVTNYFIWRQQDASRNSVQMLGHWYLSQKQMHGKNNNEVQDILMAEHQVNWNSIETWMKRGTCVIDDVEKRVDNEIPVFTQDRNYVEKHTSPPPLISHQTYYADPLYQTVWRDE